MVDRKYGIAYSELLEILKYVPVENYNKIPKSEIELFETYANKEYTFNYDIHKTLEEQNVSNITKGLIILLFRDYWATEIQRDKIIARQNYDRMKLEGQKEEKYNANNIFKDNYKNTVIVNKEDNPKTALINISDIKWYKKIWIALRDFFSK